MRLRAAIVHAAWLQAAAACTITPASDDGGVGGGATCAATRTLGDQCTDLLTELCQKEASCAISVGTLKDCIDGEMPSCCSGSACNAISTTNECMVGTCKQSIDAADCSVIVGVHSVTPAACLQ
jgi:hypothetical protein